MKPGIIFDKVSFSYQGKTNQIKNASFHIPPGSFYGITGLNGSGKSTLVLLMNGLIPHQIDGNLTGNIFVDQVNTGCIPFATDLLYNALCNSYSDYKMTKEQWENNIKGNILIPD